MAAVEDSVLPASVGDTENNVPTVNMNVLLLVVGEPFTAVHKELIQEKITTGLQAWNAKGCNIDTEFEKIIAEDPIREGQNGECTLEWQSSEFSVRVLVNPTWHQVQSSLYWMWGMAACHRQLVFAGPALRGTGSWILQDDVFTAAQFAAVYRNSGATCTDSSATFLLHASDEGDWTSANLARYKLPPVGAGEGVVTGAERFAEYICERVCVRTAAQLLPASDVVGNIRFSQPTMYIFPGGGGDAALFAINGFNLLLNGGAGRRACFWDFARHLDRVDAILLTHPAADSLFGLGTVLQRKTHNEVHPEIGYVYYNAPQVRKADEQQSLLLSLPAESSDLVENLTALGCPPNPCIAPSSGPPPAITLYQKVGHGTLQMYVLNPVAESRELREFMTQWGRGAAKGHSGIPLANLISVCALLVWRPAAQNEPITRILFPGNVPQSKVFEGLDRLKALDVLQHPTCAQKDLVKGNKKTSPASRSAPPAKVPSPRATPAPTRKQPAPAPEKKTADKPTAAGKPKGTTKKTAPAAKSSKTSGKASATSSSSAETTSSSPDTSKQLTPSAVEPTVGAITDIAAEPVVATEPEPVKEMAPVMEPEPVEEPKAEVVVPDEPLIMEAEPAVVAAAPEPMLESPSTAQPEDVVLEEKPEMPSEPEPLTEVNDKPIVQSQPFSEPIEDTLSSELCEPVETSPSPFSDELLSGSDQLPAQDERIHGNGTAEDQHMESDLMTGHDVHEPAQPPDDVPFERSSPEPRCITGQPDMSPEQLDELGIYDGDKENNAGIEPMVFGDSPPQGLPSPHEPDYIVEVQKYEAMDKGEVKDDIIVTSDEDHLQEPMQERHVEQTRMPEVQDGHRTPDTAEIGRTPEYGMSPEPTDFQNQEIVQDEQFHEHAEVYGQEEQEVQKEIMQAQQMFEHKEECEDVNQQEQIFGQQQEEQEVIPDQHMYEQRDIFGQDKEQEQEDQDHHIFEQSEVQDEEQEIHQKPQLYEQPDLFGQEEEQEDQGHHFDEQSEVQDEQQEIHQEPQLYEQPDIFGQDKEQEDQGHHFDEQSEVQYEQQEIHQEPQLYEQPDIFGQDKEQEDQDYRLDEQSEVQDEQQGNHPEPQLYEQPDIFGHDNEQEDQDDHFDEQSVVRDEQQEIHQETQLYEQPDIFGQDQEREDQNHHFDEQSEVRDEQQDIHQERQLYEQPDIFGQDQEREDQNHHFDEQSEVRDEQQDIHQERQLYEHPDIFGQDKEQEDQEHNFDEQSEVRDEQQEIHQETQLYEQPDLFGRHGQETEQEIHQESHLCEQPEFLEEREIEEEEDEYKGKYLHQQEISPVHDEEQKQSMQEPDKYEQHATNVAGEEDDINEQQDVDSIDDLTEIENQQAYETGEPGDQKDGTNKVDCDVPKESSQEFGTEDHNSEDCDMPEMQELDGRIAEMDNHERDLLGDDVIGIHNDVVCAADLYSQNVTNGQLNDPLSDTAAAPDVIPQYTDDFPVVQQVIAPAETGPVDLLGDIGDSSPSDASDNPAMCMSQEKTVDRDSLERDFDPLASWGQPLGLPAPNNAPATAAKKTGQSTAAPSSRDTKKPGEKKSNVTAGANGNKSKQVGTKATTRTPLTTGRLSLGVTRSSAAKSAANGKANLSLCEPGTKNISSAKRPPPAAVNVRKPKAATSAPNAAAHTDTAKSRPPTGRVIAPNKTQPASRGRQGPPVVPAYVDLAYIPCHGNTHHVDSAFFKRVRARYYVLSAASGATSGSSILQALLDGKQAWPEMPVTLISTYHSENLHESASQLAQQLRECNVSMAPSADRCTIQLQHHETSCNVFRLEFAPKTAA